MNNYNTRDRVNAKFSIPDILILNGKRYNGKSRIESPLLPEGMDKHPSFQIFPDHWYDHREKNGGDSISLHSLLRGISYGEALKELANKAGIPWGDFDPEKYKKQQDEKARVQEIHSAFLCLCENELENNEEMQAWCEKKWGFGRDIQREYGFGYCTEAVYQHLSKEYGKKRIKQAGLMSEGERKLFVNRIVLPYFNYSKKPIYFIGRETPQTTWGGKYIKAIVSDTVVNPLYIINGEGETLYVTEGIGDGISISLATGNTVISPVTTSIKGADIQKIAPMAKRFKEVIIVNDNEENESGEKGAKKTVHDLRKHGVTGIKLIELPRPEGVEKIDINDFLRDPTEEKKQEFLALPRRKLWEIMAEEIDKSNIVDEIEPVFEELIREEGEEKARIKADFLIRKKYEVKGQALQRSYVGLFNEVAKSIRKEAKADLRGREKDGLIPGVIAETFCEKYHPITVNGKLYFYKDGVYKPDGETLPAEIQAKLGTRKTTTHLKNEIFNYVKDKRIIKKELINSEEKELNLINGILDLDTGELKEHSKKKYCTIRIPIKYDQEATCDKFLKFLEEVAQPEDILFLQEFMGYCLIPTTKFKKAVMLTGTKDTGKSVFLEVIQKFVGWDNISFIPLQELTDSRFMKAEIYGKLVNMFADLSPFSVRDSKIFMTVTSGDPITGERKGQNPFTFRPFSKLIFSANKIPKSHNKTVAYIERWEYIHFGNVIPEAKKDRGLIDKLTTAEELSGILRWALEGLSRLYKQNCFTTSKNSQKMKAEWQKYNDIVTSYIQEECVLDNELSIGKQLLYENFCEYSKRNGVKNLSQKAFNRGLMEYFEEHIGIHTLKEIRPDRGKRKWQGISLSSEE